MQRERAGDVAEGSVSHERSGQLVAARRVVGFAAALLSLLATSSGCDGCGAVPLEPGAGGGGATSAGGGPGGVGGGGGATSPFACELPSAAEPEGCVDIFVDARLMPEPEAWSRMSLARYPFWRDERGLHMAWVLARHDIMHPYLIVASFDPSSGATLGLRTYDAFPEGSSPVVGSRDAAGGPGGIFAYTLLDSEDPWAPSVSKIFIGQLDEPELRARWSPPWPLAEASPLSVGWDGEAFAAHFQEQGGGWVRLVRLDEWGGELGEPIRAATMTSPFPKFSGWATDADSGRSWIVSTQTGGVWLSGHERDGSPLPGAGPEAGLKLTGNGAPPIYLEGWYPAVGTGGLRAMVGWHGKDPTLPEYESRLQLVDGAMATGEALRLIEVPGWGARGPRAIALTDEGWWMGVRTSCGLESLRFAGGRLVSRELLVHIERPACHPSCGYVTPHFPAFAQLLAVRSGEELWLGFEDRTYSIIYRIVRVKEGCRYPTGFDVDWLGKR